MHFTQNRGFAKQIQILDTCVLIFFYCYFPFPQRKLLQFVWPGQTIEQSLIQRYNFARSIIVRPFGRPCCSSNIFCSIKLKCWIEFDFNQTLCPTILLNEKMLQCFAALPTKLYPEASHVGHAGQSRISILFSGMGFSRHLQQRWRTKRTSWLLMNSQRAREGKKGRRRRIRKSKLWTDVQFNSV